MINLNDGKINLGTEYISTMSDFDKLNELAEKGLIKKRKEPGKDGVYFYVETVTEGIRFGVSISLHHREVDYILLRWIDSPMKGWDDASEKALKDEYGLLLNFVENNVRRPPDNKKNRQRTWRLKWGQVEVSYEPRSFDAAIFMVPQRGRL